MRNIVFLDREEELRLIQTIKGNNFFLVIKGRRRIGKTTFLKKAFPDSIYLFIWPNKSIEWITAKISEEYQLPQFKNFMDILKYLLEEKKILILDEFQNFLNVDKSLYGEIQKLVDEKKFKKEFLKIAVAGSSYSLINKVFNDAASPLYGRRTAEIELKNLPIKELYQGLGLPLEEFVKLWVVFEGVPYYYELIEPIKSEANIKKLVLSPRALLQEEGKLVLSVEFGRDSKTYSTVLSAIAEGKTKLNEIATLFSDKTNEVIKYLEILRKEFRLIKRATPILADPQKSKEGHYQIIDNFLSFWFYFLDKQKSYLEQERFEEVEAFFDKNFKAFVGQKFEKLILELIKSEIIDLGFKWEKIGRQWGKMPLALPSQNQYEIDLCAVNEQTKEILFGECKWQDKVNVKKVLAELKEKIQYVNWHNQERKEYFAIFAKSFKEKIKEKGLFLFDLKDLEKLLKD